MMKAVVIEDEILIREGLCKLIDKMFPEITVSGTADNGQEGFLLIEKEKPDLVITDIKMPVMDGIEMIEQAQKSGIFPKIIVLTAYSEFSYAQQALKLGVNDYIIKPVNVQEFVQTIRKIQNLYEQEQKRTPDTIGSLEHIISNLLYGISAWDERLEDFLDKKYGISTNTPFIELLIYLGEDFSVQRERKRHEICQILKQKELKYALVDMEYDKVIVACLYDYSSRRDIERWYQNQILFQNRGGRKQNISHGMLEVSGIEHLRKGYQKLLPYMDWNIVLGNDVLIFYPHIANIQAKICIYPVELENQVKAAICMGETEKVKDIIKNFTITF